MEGGKGRENGRGNVHGSERQDNGKHGQGVAGLCEGCVQTPAGGCATPHALARAASLLFPVNVAHSWPHAVSSAKTLITLTCAYLTMRPLVRGELHRAMSVGCNKQQKEGKTGQRQRRETSCWDKKEAAHPEAGAQICVRAGT